MYYSGIFSFAGECNRLGHPRNGRVSVRSRTEGNRATYSCYSGYDLRGSSSRRCRSSGTWSGREPICRGNYMHNRACRMHFMSTPACKLSIQSIWTIQYNMLLVAHHAVVYRSK